MEKNMTSSKEQGQTRKAQPPMQADRRPERGETKNPGKVIQGKPIHTADGTIEEDFEEQAP